MIRAYINYPNPLVTVHSGLSSGTFQKHGKEDQHVVRLNIETSFGELRLFAEKNYQFEANPDTNDMWLEVDFMDLKFEWSVIDYIRLLLSWHCTPFAKVNVDQHC